MEGGSILLTPSPGPPRLAHLSPDFGEDDFVMILIVVFLVVMVMEDAVVVDMPTLSHTHP